MGEAIGAALSSDAVFGQPIRDVDIPVSCLFGVDDDDIYIYIYIYVYVYIKLEI